MNIVPVFVMYWDSPLGGENMASIFNHFNRICRIGTFYPHFHLPNIWICIPGIKRETIVMVIWDNCDVNLPKQETNVNLRWGEPSGWRTSAQTERSLNNALKSHFQRYLSRFLESVYMRFEKREVMLTSTEDWY